MLNEFSNYGYLHPFRRYSQPKSEIVQKAPNFARFGPIFGGMPPEFFDQDYKIEHNSDHVAKFHGDRPRELGDLVAK